MMPTLIKVSPGPVGSILGACVGIGVEVGADAIYCGCCGCDCAGGDVGAGVDVGCVHVQLYMVEQDGFRQNPPIHANPVVQFESDVQEPLQANFDGSGVAVGPGVADGNGVGVTVGESVGVGERVGVEVTPGQVLLTVVALPALHALAAVTVQI
jgi:hypothetical protein